VKDCKIETISSLEQNVADSCVCVTHKQKNQIQNTKDYMQMKLFKRHEFHVNVIFSRLFCIWFLCGFFLHSFPVVNKTFIIYYGFLTQNKRDWRCIITRQIKDGGSLGE